MNNETQVSIKFTNKVTGEQQLKNYAEQLKIINGYLSAIDTGKAKAVDKFSNDIKNTTDNSEKINKNLNNAFNLGKITLYLRMVERLSTKISSFTKKSADYLENWNLLDVAFQNNTAEAERFVNTLSEMYGLDESWGYRTVGIFKQLANAMGVSDETGTKLAKTLTQLAIDTSSLYNIDVEDTVSILQSGLAGQTKPVRRLGGDITQNTLQLVLETHGLDETITDLSYAEKRLTIVTALLDQTRQAHGDWGRTIESVANQMRIFQQQTERLTRALGNVFLPILKASLPYLNAFLMVLTEIINWFALLIGYDPDDFDFFGGVDESIIDLNENLGSAVENTKKLQNGLRSFDKLNNIKTPSASENSGVGSGGISSDVLDMFNKASDNYLNSLDKVNMKATEIRDKIMDWLGFTKKIDKETGKISWEFTNQDNNLYKILKNLGRILGYVKDIAFQVIEKVWKNLNTGWLGNVVANSLELIADSLKWISENEFAVELLSNIVTMLITLKAISFVGSITGITKLIGMLTGLNGTLATTIGKTGTGKLAVGALGLSGMLGILGLLTAGVWTISLVTYGAEASKNIIDANSGAVSTLTDNSTNLMKAMVELKNAGQENTEQFDKLAEQLLKNIKMSNEAAEKTGMAKEEINRLNESNERATIFMKKLWEQGVITKDEFYNFAKASGYLTTKVNDFSNSSDNAKNKLWSFEEECKKISKESENTASKVKIFDERLESISKTADKNRLDKIINGAKDIGSNADISKTKLQEMQDQINRMSGRQITIDVDANMEKARNKFTEFFGAFGGGGGGGLRAANGGIFKNGMLKDITQYANGGLPPVGQMFIARERGPELVGRIGSNTAVMNNNQIVSSVADGVYQAVRSAMTNNNSGQVFNIYLDEGHMLGSYTLEQLQEMAKSNGKPITIE